MLSEILILSTSGEYLLNRKFRNDLPEDSRVECKKKLQEHMTSPTHLLPPFFDVGGVYCAYIRKQDVTFIAMWTTDISTLVVMDTISRFYHLLKDFCGVISEQSIRTNIALVCEVLDEFIDYGYVQLSRTEKLKPYVQNIPLAVRTTKPQTPGLFGLEHCIVPWHAADRPVVRPVGYEQQRNEIFVDVIERLNIVIGADGRLLRCQLHGRVNVKSFVTGSPQVKIGLVDNIVIGNNNGNNTEAVSRGYCTLLLDSCAFHESVDADEFTRHRVLCMRPSDGEFTAMTYNIDGEISQGVPFRVYAQISNASTKDALLSMKLRCEIPASCHAVNVSVHIPVPRTTTSIAQRLGGPEQTAQLKQTQYRIEWHIKKMSGDVENTAQFTLFGAGSVTLHDIGAVMLTFEISGHLCSGMQIKFLRIFDQNRSYVPLKWVRCITASDSYVVRVTL